MAEDAPPRRPTASRRRFLTTAGAAAGGGLLATPAAADRPTTSRELRATRSPTLRPLSAAGPTTEFGAATLSVSEADTATGFERFVAGETDLVHASRPMLPEEARAAADNGVRYRAVESAVDGVALLTGSDGGWRRCLSGEQLDRRLRDVRDAQMWSELVDDAAGSTAASVGTVDGLGDGIGADHPPSGPAAVVRGVRADQYATGFGGLGYYDAPATELLPIDDPAAGSRPQTPLARLRYTYAGDAALRDANVRSVLRSLETRERTVLGDLTPYADPAETIDERVSELGRRAEV